MDNGRIFPADDSMRELRPDELEMIAGGNWVVDALCWISDNVVKPIAEFLREHPLSD